MTERDNRAQDLLRTLLAEGWSQAEIARRIGRDPRLVRFVLKGLKPGTNLVSALTQLARGEDVTPPPRRRDRKGRAAKVRSKRGRPSHRPSDIGGEPPRPRGDRAPQPDAEPPEEQRIETPPRKRRHGSTPSTGQPERLERQMHKRNLLRHEVTNLPHHRSSHILQFPRSNEDARGQASDLLTEILSEGRGQRMHAKLWIEVDKRGRRERQIVRLGDKGGYDCGLALEDVRLFRDALSWLEDQAGQRYGNAADTGRLIGVEIDVW